MEKQEYTVQRKVITWEFVNVEATSFDEALELAHDSESWDEVYDQAEATEDYWVKNQDTDVAKTKEGYFAEWESAI
jgi:hypothetical protein